MDREGGVNEWAGKGWMTEERMRDRERERGGMWWDVIAGKGKRRVDAVDAVKEKKKKKREMK